MLIKYPISKPPTKYQLDSLPAEIYEEWIRRLGFEFTSIGIGIFRRELMITYMQRTFDSDPKAFEDCYNKLIHLIYMLDE